MTKRFNSVLISLTITFALVLTGCSSQAGQKTGLSSFTPMQVSADNCNYGGEIKSVEAIDEFTVRFTLCTADVAFPSKIASPIFAIQDKAFLDSRQGETDRMMLGINGTGPYTLESYDADGTLALNSSATYWGMPAPAQTLVFHFVDQAGGIPTSAELSAVDGIVGVNYVHSLDPNIDEFTTRLKHTSLGLVYLGFNNHIKPVDNPVVRQAIAKVIDRSKLVQSTLPEGTVVANQMIPLTITPGRSGTLGWYDLNPNDARNALVNVGFDFNQELTLAYVDGSVQDIEDPQAMAQEIKTELAGIQVNVTLKPMSRSEFDQALTAGSEMMFINHFRALYPDGAAFYELPFLRQATQFGETYTDLQTGLSEVQSESNLVTRQQKFDVLNQKLKELTPLIPIGNVPDYSFFRESVSNVAANGYFVNLEDAVTGTNSMQLLVAKRPSSLWPADETDYDTFRITRLLYDTLVSYDFQNSALQPDLADSWTSNTNATQWTFALRYSVKYSNGATLDANDVVTSFSAIWNAADKNHKGSSGDFTLFKQLFGSLLNE